MSTKNTSLQNYTCPNCNNIGQYTTEEEETICDKCGLVLITAYPYVAGKRHKTISDYQIEQKNKQIRRKRKWKTKSEISQQSSS